MNEMIDRDGVDRRGFLKCMAWVGTGVLWSVSGGGVVTSAVMVGGTMRLTEPSAFSSRCSRSLHAAIGRSEVTRLPLGSTQL